MESQPTLVELEPLPVESSEPIPDAGPATKLVFGQKNRKRNDVDPGSPKLKPVDRSQLMMKTIDLEHLLEAAHPARAIMQLLAKLDLSMYYSAIRTQEGKAGRAAYSPAMLCGVWIYAYSQGIGSAREIERLMAYEPGLMWLCGADVVNHHTLSDFRSTNKEALDNLFQQLLAVLEGEGIVDLGQVMHDGTKIRANTGADTFRRQKTLDERLKRAKQLLDQMGDPREDNQQSKTRREAAQKRAAQERVAKMEAALEELKQIQEGKTAAEAEQARVSMVEPEARIMKHGDNAMAPSYNVQLSTEASNKIIVGMHLSQCSSDAQSLEEAVNVIEENMDQRPAQMVVDGGFTSKANIIAMDQRGVDLVGSLPDLEKRRKAGAAAAGIDPGFTVQFFILQEHNNTLQCPAGKELKYESHSVKRGNKYKVYRAKGRDCCKCEFQSKCCPREPAKGRRISVLVEEDANISQFRQKMASEQARQIYKKRGPVAEFPNAWIKDKIKLRKYRLRGMSKAAMETMWACLAYNIKQWVRLCWRSLQAVPCTA
jgi:transposase